MRAKRRKWSFYFPASKKPKRRGRNGGSGNRWHRHACSVRQCDPRVAARHWCAHHARRCWSGRPKTAFARRAPDAIVSRKRLATVVIVIETRMRRRAERKEREGGLALGCYPLSNEPKEKMHPNAMPEPRMDLPMPIGWGAMCCDVLRRDALFRSFRAHS